MQKTSNIATYYRDYTVVDQSAFCCLCGSARGIKNLLSKFGIGLWLVDMRIGYVKERVKASHLKSPRIHAREIVLVDHGKGRIADGAYI